MYSALVLIFFPLVSSLNVLQNGNSIVRENCETIFTFSEVCMMYEFKDRCWPWNLTDCNILNIETNNLNCESFNCPVTKFNIYNLY